MKKIFVLSFLLAFLIIAFSRLTYSQVFWEELPQIVMTPLNSVSDYDCSIAYACGDSATVLKTTNRGYNWTNVSLNGISANVNLVNIFIVSVTPLHTVIAAGYSGSNTFLYRTTNSGANWVQVFTQQNGFINAVWFTSETSGLMVGDPVGGRWSLWKSTNGGLNWDSTGLYLHSTGTEAGFANSFWMSGSNVWFGANNSRVYRSVNGGLSWSYGSISPEAGANAIWMGPDPFILGYAAGNSLYKSTDAGLVWTLDNGAAGTGAISSFTGNTQIFNYLFYTRGSSIYYKFVNGSSWMSMYTAPAGVYNHMSMARSTMYYGPGWIYAVRSNGRISRANTFIEGVRLISNDIPDEYSLSQNYPNPFNSSTKFTFDTRRLPEMSIGEIRGGNVKIAIYNSLGREVEVLINKVLQPAVYEINWDASRYASGLYYYRMLVTNPNGGSVVYDRVKKMALIK